MKVLELPAGKSPREWGRIHGETFRGEVKALADIRTYLCTKVGGFSGREPVLAAARAHLPVLERYDSALCAELLGIAEGAALTPEEIVVANHYTDLRDLDPDPASWKLAGDTGCSMVWAPGILAQTWDMHASAIPYVILLSTPDAKLLTVTGCLGMCGMNSAKVGLTINNLFSTDARIGAVWPAIVRRALRERTAAQAFEVIQKSPIGSGRHYFVADRQGAHALEASGTRQTVMPTSGGSYCHTNHSLRPEIAANSKIPPTSTTHQRMQWLERDLARAPVRDLDDAWKRLGDGVDVDQSTPDAPHAPATCGAIAMNLESGELWAQQGHIHGVAPEKFHV